MVRPKKSHLVVLKYSSFGLNLIPFIRAVSSNWSRFTSWSLESTPLVRTSSMHPVIPFTSLRTAFSLSWNTSALTLRPKGSRSHLYFPHGVLKVVRSELSLSNSTIQYPEAASPSVKYFPLWSSGLTSSIVFEQYWFLLMLLLRSFGSRHSRIDPSGLDTGATLLIQSVFLNWFNDSRTAQSFKLFFVCCFLLLRYCSRWMLYRLCVWLELDMVLAPW